MTPLSFKVATASEIFEVYKPMCCIPGPPCSLKNVCTWLGPEIRTPNKFLIAMK